MNYDHQNFKAYDKIVRRWVEVDKNVFKKSLTIYKKIWITIVKSLNRHRKISHIIHNNQFPLAWLHIAFNSCLFLQFSNFLVKMYTKMLQYD